MYMQGYPRQSSATRNGSVLTKYWRHFAQGPLQHDYSADEVQAAHDNEGGPGFLTPDTQLSVRLLHSTAGGRRIHSPFLLHLHLLLRRTGGVAHRARTRRA